MAALTTLMTRFCTGKDSWLARSGTTPHSGTPDKPANHTNRDCWVFKLAGKINAENKDKGLHNDDDEEPWCTNTGGQKKFPPQVKTVNMIYATHIPKRERKRVLRDVCAIEPVAPKFNPWSLFPITFDRRDLRQVSVMAVQPHWSSTQSLMDST